MVTEDDKQAAAAVTSGSPAGAPQGESAPGGSERQGRDAVPPAGAVWLLSGPEGGLTAEEEAAAVAAGFVPVTLGPRVLRAETAPLAVLGALLV